MTTTSAFFAGYPPPSDRARPPASPPRPRRARRSAVRVAAAAASAVAGGVALLSSSSLDGDVVGLPPVAGGFGPLARRFLESTTSSSPAAADEEEKKHERRRARREERASLCGYPLSDPQTFSSESEIEPTLAASYPGSGARMTWMLVQSITGQITGDEHGFSGQGNRVVTMKTHFPHPMGVRGRDWPGEIKRAVVLLRNPADAIPSYHNFLYEYENKLRTHSTRAPHDVWEQWRDNDSGKDGELKQGGFRRLLDSWVEFVKYWMDNYPEEEENRLTLAYEDLVGDATGANVTTELAGFLKRAKGVRMVPDDAVECTWRRVVKGKGKSESLRKGGGERRRAYRREQLEWMAEAMDGLKRDYEGEERLVSILDMYRSDIEARLDDGEATSPTSKDGGNAKISRRR